MGKFFQVESVGRKAVLLLNRPPHNFLNREMCQELTSFLESFSQNDFDGLIIASREKHFCAGADVAEHLPGEVETMLPAFDKLSLTLAEFPLPTVAAISGSCLGGGLELARSCRCVIALNPEKLYLGVPEIQLACYPPVGLAVFPRLSDVLKATVELIFTGKTLKGKSFKDLEQAYDIGLIDGEFTGTLDEFINSVDFRQIAEIPKISELFSEPLSISDNFIEQTLSGDEAIRQLDPTVLDIAIKVMVACAQKTSLKSALELAEQVYLESIAPLPAYEKALINFLSSQKN